MRRREWTGEEILLVLAFGLDQLTSRSLPRLLESYEGWEYRNRLRHHLRRFESQQLLKRETRAAGLVYRLTDAGQVAIAGGRHPEQRWNRPWDGHWRLLLFDLPERPQRVRLALWRWLRANHFGCLQHSVWLSPDPVPAVVAALADFRDDANSFTVMESSCVSGTASPVLASSAWDFVEINKRYQVYLSAARPPGGGKRSLYHAWLRQERLAWGHAVSIDPLLPRPLWPEGYLGEKAWQTRRHTLGQFAARFLRKT
jgi:phenylacetic acid degradation operon negative regulatory protein